MKNKIKCLLVVCIISLLSFGIIGCRNINDLDTVKEGIGYVNICGLKVKGGTAGDTVFFLEGWIPGNEWGGTSPNKAVVDEEGNAVLDLDPVYQYTTGDDIVCQIVGGNPAPSGSGDDFWNHKYFTGGNPKVTNPWDKKTYYVVFDKASNKLSLEEKK